MNNLLTQKFPITAFALLFVLTMSCSHEPTVEPQEPGGTDVAQWNDSTINGDAVMTEMAFSVSDGNMIVERQETTTRSTTAFDGTGSFSENDLIAIAVTRSGESEVVKLYRMKNDGSLEYAGSDNAPFVWKSTSETVSIRAWSYGTDANLSYMLDAPETIEYDLETDQNTNGYQELLYCKAADKNYSTSAITLNFYHQLTRLVFNVDHELEDDLAVTSVSIGGAIPTKAQFSVPTGNGNYIGTWSIKSATGSITPHEDNTEAGYQKTYSVVIFPETYAKNSTIFTLTNSDGNYVYSISEDAGQTLVAGNQYNYTITVKNGYVENFSYVASAQTFTAPQTGTYKIECWGASGGNATVCSTSYGGYVSGIISLTKAQILYVYTGQQGNKENVYSSSYMFNGGGYANKTSNGCCGTCGGGATDVRTVDGDWDDITSLESRIIIAAGGGGGTNFWGSGGFAGGLQGYNGTSTSSATYNQYCGKGATQTAGGAVPAQFAGAENGTAGSLGTGGIGGHSIPPNSYGGGGAGGGGGLYGGSGSSGLQSGTWVGGGGSSYISGHPGCTAKELTFSSPVMIDGAGYQWTSTSAGSRVGIPTIDDASVKTNGYIGDGYCRITRYGY